MKTMMAVAEAPPEKTRYTPEDLLELQDDRLYELVDGELVEKHMGSASAWITGELFGKLRDHNTRTRQGWLLPSEASYRCFPDDPSKVRRPDISFVRYGRLEGEEVPEGHTTVPPDLAVEVVSPSDRFAEVRAKVREYLAAGVPMVWVVDPAMRAVEVWREDAPSALLRENEELSGEDVLPGFTCRVGELFPPRAAEAAPEAAVPTDARTGAEGA
jgi:Uma2 family endonuclease